MRNAFKIYGTAASYKAENRVPTLQQKLGKIGAILASNSGNQRDFLH
jgi:hypothetical protein